MDKTMYVFDRNVNAVAAIVDEDNITYIVNSIQSCWDNGSRSYRNIISTIPKKDAILCGKKVTDTIPLGTRVFCISPVGSLRKSLLYGTVKAYREDISNVIGVEFDCNIGGHDLKSVIFSELFNGEDAHEGRGWWVDTSDLYFS